MKKLSKDTKILFYFFLILLIIWLIFDSLKYSWTDDPFQKVILAPLGEEPFKILIGLLSCIYAYSLYQIVNRIKKEKKQKTYFMRTFYEIFIPFSLVMAVLFGYSEGPINNILLHFSTTSIATMLIIGVFQKIKDKQYKTCWKVTAMLSTLSIPMLLHSISNQYANIIYANNNPGFDHLVIIGRFLENNTFISNQGIYTLILFYVALMVFIYFIYKYYIFKETRLIKNDM